MEPKEILYNVSVFGTGPYSSCISVYADTPRAAVNKMLKYELRAEMGDVFAIRVENLTMKQDVFGRYLREECDKSPDMAALIAALSEDPGAKQTEKRRMLFQDMDERLKQLTKDSVVVFLGSELQTIIAEAQVESERAQLFEVTVTRKVKQTDYVRAETESEILEIFTDDWDEQQTEVRIVNVETGAVYQRTPESISAHTRRHEQELSDQDVGIGFCAAPTKHSGGGAPSVLTYRWMVKHHPYGVVPQLGMDGLGLVKAG